MWHDRFHEQFLLPNIYHLWVRLPSFFACHNFFVENWKVLYTSNTFQVLIGIYIIHKKYIVASLRIGPPPSPWGLVIIICLLISLVTDWIILSKSILTLCPHPAPQFKACEVPKRVQLWACTWPPGVTVTLAVQWPLSLITPCW